MSERALRHNSNSIQQNVAASGILTDMHSNESINIFAHLEKDEYLGIRKMMVNLILGSEEPDICHSTRSLHPTPLYPMVL